MIRDGSIQLKVFLVKTSKRYSKIHSILNSDDSMTHGRSYNPPRHSRIWGSESNRDISGDYRSTIGTTSSFKMWIGYTYEAYGKS